MSKDYFNLFFMQIIFFIFSVSAYAKSSLQLQNQISNNYIKQSKLISMDEARGAFVASSCTGDGPEAICIGVGYKTKFPLLLQTQNGGINWQKILIGEGKILGQFYSASCIGKGSEALCIAGGEFYKSDNHYPFMIQTRDGGNSWNRINLNLDFSQNGSIHSISCTGEVNKAICVAVGKQDNDPLVLQSLDGGENWKIVANFPQIVDFVQCTGQGQQAFCIAIKLRQNQIFQFDAKTKIWKVVDIKDLPANSHFFSGSCTGNGKDVTCVVSGQEYNNLHPLIIRTNNRGQVWNLEILEKTGWFTTSQCIGEKQTLFCSIEGYYNGNYVFGRSNDTTNWEFTTEPKPLGDLKSFSCLRLNDKPFCISAGGIFEWDTTTLPCCWDWPLLLQTVNGIDWDVHSIENIDEGAIASTSCTPSGSLCVAVGYKRTGNSSPWDTVPSIAQTTDLGIHWRVVGEWV